ncbi:MAG: hypothetical protein EKK33_08980 [Bradyrhizobiaceae bacterium]|nr:MAG: hypothetical protein EKK33_08980 [Bradyrhizobiaceae bacterium]
MPFNGSGVFTTVNTFIPNTVILSSAVNQNFTDIATGLSDCLTRDGQAGMTAAFKAIAGSLGAPGISFTNDATSGLYLNAVGVLGLVAKSLGIAVNSAVYCPTAATVAAGGSGYAVGDTITLTGGTAISQAVLTVATLSGSAVATVTVTYPGFYTVKPSDPVAQGSTSGSGSGATFNMTWDAQYANSVVTSEAGAVPWQRLGASSYVSSLMAKPNAYDFAKTVVTYGSGLSLSNSTSPPTLTTTLNPTLVPNYISGLTMSTAGSSATMTIAAGVANDSTNTTLMRLASSIGKTTASWAVGTGNGGLDTGSIAINTWYHFYQIYRPDTQVVDVTFSTSASAPTLPTNYTLYRRIGAGRTNGSSQWTAFTQTGNEFFWSAPVTDQNVAGGTPSGSYTVSVPSGVPITARMLMNYRSTNVGSTVLWYAASVTGSQSVNSPTGNITSATVVSGVDSFFSSSILTLNGQITASSNGSGSIVWSIVTIGWIDSRGM